MTDATIFGRFNTPVKTRATEVPQPGCVPFAMPVLMSDAITPLAGETVLSLLWKRLEASSDDGG